MFTGAHLMATQRTTKKAPGKTKTPPALKKAPSKTAAPKEAAPKPKGASAKTARGGVAKTAPKKGTATKALEPSADDNPRLPDFRLTDQKGQLVSRKELLGAPFVLYFYPKDDTPGCTTEACEFSNDIRKFEKLSATVLGCSADDAEKHKKFIAKYKLKIDLLSDPTHAVMAKYGAWGEKVLYGRKMEGVIRSTTIIDPDGKVARHWKKVKAAGHAESVQAVLTDLQSE
jgi:peroxiredoxin Q/BCP